MIQAENVPSNLRVSLGSNCQNKKVIIWQKYVLIWNNDKNLLYFLNFYINTCLNFQIGDNGKTIECNDVEVGDVVDFTVDVQADECSNQPQTILLKPVGLNQILRWVRCNAIKMSSIQMSLFLKPNITTYYCYMYLNQLSCLELTCFL